MHARLARLGTVATTSLTLGLLAGCGNSGTVAATVDAGSDGGVAASGSSQLSLSARSASPSGMLPVAHRESWNCFKLPRF